MTDALVCWRCGMVLEAADLPIARLAECRACGAQLHVCRMCRFFDPRLRRGCREERAEDVLERERANFCGYFTPRAGAHRPGADAAAQNAQAQLDGLFGGDAPAPSSGAPSALEELFRAPGEQKKD
jgi:hypothetical protein